MVFWGVAVLLTIPIWPLPRADAALGIGRETHALFTTKTQEIAYELARRCPLPPQKRLIVIGSSGARAFHADLLEGATPAEEVITLSFEMTNWSTMRRALADVRACLGPDGMRQAAFLLVPAPALTFMPKQQCPCFVGDYSVYEQEKRRNLMFRGPPGDLNAALPARWMPLAVELWRPVLLMRSVDVNLEKRIKAGIGGITRRFLPSGATETHQQYLARAVANFRQALYSSDGSFAQEQVPVLRDLIKDLQSQGSSVVLVEQPLQRGLRDDPINFIPARALQHGIAREHGVAIVDLYESAEESEFLDLGHANEQSEPIWSARLANALRQLQVSQPSALGALMLRAELGSTPPALEPGTAGARLPGT